MAQLRTFKCKKCGYSVLTEHGGHYALMSGEFYNFKCSHCNGQIAAETAYRYSHFHETTCLPAMYTTEWIQQHLR